MDRCRRCKIQFTYSLEKASDLCIKEVSEKRIPIMLCGNKLDLRQELVNKGCKCVSSEMGERVSRDHSATFLETSSKDGGNVIDALVQLSR